MENSIIHSRAYRVSYTFFTLFIITSGISISISQAFLILTLISWIFGLFTKCHDIKYYKTGLEKYIVVFILVSIILAFFSPSIIANLQYLKDFWLVSAFVVASSLVNNRDDVLKIIKLLIIVAIFQSIAGFIQYIVQINFVNAFNNGINHPGAHLRMRYLVGFLGHHLTYGGYMMISIPLVYLSFVKKNNYKGIIYIRIAAVLSVAALILSWARSVIISLPFAAIPMLFTKKRAFIIYSISFITIVLVVFSTFGPSKNIINNLYTESSKIRLQIWKNALRVWQKNPLFGAGGGNYHSDYKQVVMDNMKENSIFSYYFPGMTTHAHNDYLNQLARKGIIGLLAFLYMLFGIFKFMSANIKYMSNDKLLRYFYLGFFSYYCVFLIAAMFQCFYTDEENLVMLWFTLGLIASLARIKKNGGQQEDL